MTLTETRRFGATWSERDFFDGAVAFESMRADFEKAAARHPDEFDESYYIFAGRSVRIRIVGHELTRHFGRPFSHLRTREQKPGPPKLTIDIWDANKSNAIEKIPDRNDLKWIETTVKSLDGRFIGQRLPHTYSCLDRESGHIVSSIAWHDRIFIYERAKPLARPLLEWHNDQDVQIAHTGLVARDGKGVLFAGKSGSGKSTMSLASVCAGLDYLSDDYVSLQRQLDGSFAGHSLYNSVFLETTHLVRFSELLPHVIKGQPPEEAKSVIILSQLFPDRLKREARISALVLPRVGESSIPQLRPATKGEALLGFGPSSLLQLPNRGLGARGFGRLAQLVEQVPCYWLEVTSDLKSNTSRVEDLLTALV